MHGAIAEAGIGAGRMGSSEGKAVVIVFQMIVGTWRQGGGTRDIGIVAVGPAAIVIPGASMVVVRIEPLLTVHHGLRQTVGHLSDPRCSAESRCSIDDAKGRT